jgi:hypothetical protein
MERVAKEGTGSSCRKKNRACHQSVDAVGCVLVVEEDLAMKLRHQGKQKV